MLVLSSFGMMRRFLNLAFYQWAPKYLLHFFAIQIMSPCHDREIEIALLNREMKRIFAKKKLLINEQIVRCPELF